MSSDSPPTQYQLDTELLIKEVKARPSLYAKDAPKYNDNNYKRVLWDEVTSMMFPNNWSKWSEEEQADKAELVQRRWKNVRACYTREIKRQKDPQWIYGVSYKRRKYLYFNELSFLKTESDKAEIEVTHDIDLPEKTDGDNTKVTIDTNIDVTPIPDPVPMPKCDSQSVSSSKVTTATNEDSTNFALSIVPMLNMIPIEKRIDAHISILSILKKFLKEENEKASVKVGLASKRLNKNKNKVDMNTIEVKSEAESDDDIKYFSK